jgi:hypothetical protein
VTSPIIYGAEGAETFTGTVTGQVGDGNPQGTVTVYYGSPTATELCTSPLSASGSDAATFSCALSASQLAAGTYTSVDAVYTPGSPSSSDLDATYGTSTSSPTQSFTVNPAPEATTTALNTITSPITYGAETTETFTGTVTGQVGDGYPQGTVSVQSGATVLCSETLPAGTTDVASFSCSPTSGTVLAASSSAYPVTATFTPVTPSSSNANVTYGTSTSSPAQSFTVNAAPETTTTSLNAVASPITFGAEGTEVFTGTVIGQAGDGNPQGTVTVYYGSPTATELCSSPLSASGSDAATFSCALSASQLAAGIYTSVDAVYTPGSPSSSDLDFTYGTSTSSPTQSFTVSTSISTESTTTSLNAVTSPITFGAEGTEVFTGTVTGQAGDGNPQGTVTLYYGTTPTELCTSPLSASGTDAATFSCALSASQLDVGTYTSVDAVYTPGAPSSSNASFAYTTSTSSPAQSFTVNNPESGPQPTSVTTSLSGGGGSGATVSVGINTAVSDSATLSGTNAVTAMGTVTYNVYSDAGCTTAVSTGAPLSITSPGVLPASSAVSLANPGLYYWQVSYSGDAANAPSASACGSEIETVSSPGTVATTTICQTGQSCTGTVTIPGSEGVSITGTSSTTGSITVAVGTNTVSCGDPFRHAPSMTTVTVQGLSIDGTKTAVITIDKSVVFAKGAPWWIPYAVCYSSPVPFRDVTGKLTTLGLLPACGKPFLRPSQNPGQGGNGSGNEGDGGWESGFDHAGGWSVGSGFVHDSLASPPCVTSILPDKAGDVVETLQLPGYDPRFH